MENEKVSKLIDGKKIAQDIQKEIRDDIDQWVSQGHRPPCLIAVLVGEDPASKKYVENKMIAAQNVGIVSRTINLPSTISEQEIISQIYKLNKDPSVDGILVQLPVPEHVSERNVCNSVDPRKDVDGFHILNMGKLAINMDTFVPATALGVIELIKRSNIKTFGKNIVVCGRSKNVGLPIALLLHSDARNDCPGLEATVTLCHRHTPSEELEFFAKRADIIISATGVVNLIKPDMVKPGACIIDVGITRITTESGKTKLVGDVDFDGVSHVAGYITPVPGGVGPMTVAMLMHNTFKAAKALANDVIV
ncbi:bifunctional methylenetetrahydrofolate dehydrogenase/cyclohydrolase, mitochondrial isoform X2 [Cylas formicarius]|uniref:bifunctional methylenetetrahydrofolate dehydrogenase/cyclohydrolase, mitochondrial isoform X2 n=1 Tax=Cylas formicarius TaxID=197179 RepID=UPI0029585A8F|nr:bifunctional methylenetetrahydrofolate dehydrogenase/cyclohydrolase, mitochondrial isoform X2 [Cylas formicarius]